MTDNSSFAKLIEANAGSGKTFSLTLEYIKLLLQGESVQHILATTFTKKAASEILSRVIKRLAQAVVDKKHEAELLNQLGLTHTKVTVQAALGRLIKMQHKMMISTMDSFFAKIATIFSTELGFSSKINITTDDMKKAIISQAINKLCNIEKSGDIYFFLKDLNKNLETKSINDKLQNYFLILYNEFKKTKKENWITLENKVELPDKLKVDELIKIVSDTQCPKTAKGGDRARYADLKRKIINDLSNQDWDNIIQSTFFDNILDGKMTYDRIDIPQDFFNIGNTILSYVDSYNVNKLNKKTRAVYNLLEKFSVFYEEIRNGISTLDFSELKFALQQIATSDNLPEIYYRLDTNFKHILLDEFQDTSLEEWIVIEPIIAEILSTIDRTFFCVGDPKQAIYAWRGGVSDIFKKITSNWPQVEKRELVKSYRSSQVIIDFVNLICKNFEKIRFEDDYKELACNWDLNFPIHEVGNKNLKGHVQVKIIYKDSGDGNTISVEETNQTLDEIIIENTCKRVKELSEKYPGISIGILCRGNQFVGEIISALNKEPYNIRASQEGKIKLIDFNSVVFILSVFKYLKYPDDTMCLFKIKSVIEDLFDDKCSDLFDTLKIILMHKGFEGVSIFLYERIKSKLSNIEKTAVEQLIDVCIDYDQKSNKNIDEFIKNISLQTMVNATSSNVRVMTMHSAKGLEFDAVILPKLDDGILAHPNFLLKYSEDRTKAIDKIYVNASGKIGKILERNHPEFYTMQLQERLLKLEEAFCLLYVALTRAKQSLTIFISGDEVDNLDKDKISYNMASFILQILGRDVIDSGIYELGVRDFYEKPGIRKQEVEEKEKLTFVSFVKSDKEKNLMFKNASGQEGDDDILVGDILNLNLEHTLKRGSGFHKFFEKILWIDDIEINKENFITKDLANDFSNEEINSMFVKFKKSLEFSTIKNRLLKSYYLNLWNVDSLEVLIEEPFVFKESDIIYNGFIDRVVLGYRDNKLTNIEIIDYKSDVFSHDEMSKKSLFYKPQIDVYKKALLERYGGSVKINTALLFVLMGKVIEYSE